MSIDTLHDDTTRLAKRVLSALTYMRLEGVKVNEVLVHPQDYTSLVQDSNGPVTLWNIPLGVRDVGLSRGEIILVPDDDMENLFGREW